MNVIFMGTPEIAIPTLQTLIDFPECDVQAVYTQPDRPVGRKKILTPSPIKEYAQSLNIPVKTPIKANASKVIEELQQMSPQLIIVCAYGQILPQTLLDIPNLGCFNSHFSFLPRWRGASPVHAAIKAGDTSTGVSLQKMVRKLDAGPIAALSPEVKIEPKDTYQTLVTKLSLVSKELLLKTLPCLLDQKIEFTEQNKQNVTFCRTIRKQEGMIRWNEESAIGIERKLRAFSPWPGIYTFDEKRKRLQILELNVLTEQHTPGEVHNKLIVGTRKGSLLINILKPEGKNQMNANEFLKGNPSIVGSILQ